MAAKYAQAFVPAEFFKANICLQIWALLCPGHPVGSFVLP